MEDYKEHFMFCWNLHEVHLHEVGMTQFQHTMSTVHSNLLNIMHVATKAHVTLRRYIVLIRMRANRELV